LHAGVVFDLGQVDGLRAVDVDKHLSVYVIVVRGIVPDWVDHENVLSRLQRDFRVQERKAEATSEPSVDELSRRRHQQDVELSWREKLLLVFESVVLKTVTLLKD